MNNKCIYLVIFDWSVYGDRDVEIRAFEKYTNALEYFKELIDFEKEYSWIADILKDDEVKKDYYFQEYINTDDTKECDCHWYVASTYERDMYSYIDLRVIPLQEYKEVNLCKIIEK